MYKLNYDDATHLDAEALAEKGIGEAYKRLMPLLCQYVDKPTEICEFHDEKTGSYSVRCGSLEFKIADPELEEHGNRCWGRATFAFFSIVNGQLASSSHRLYAINGGNDLFGIFLTDDQAIDSRRSLPKKTDWPYLPQDEAPWFGQHH